MDFDSLIKLSANEIKEYIKDNNVTKDQLIVFMNQNNIPYKTNMTLNKIIKYLSNELESYGIYYIISTE